MQTQLEISPHKKTELKDPDAQALWALPMSVVMDWSELNSCSGQSCTKCPTTSKFSKFERRAHEQSKYDQQDVSQLRYRITGLRCDLTSKRSQHTG